eukprot:462958-Hanusia_phi.AAC.1
MIIAGTVRYASLSFGLGVGLLSSNGAGDESWPGRGVMRHQSPRPAGLMPQQAPRRSRVFCRGAAGWPLVGTGPNQSRVGQHLLTRFQVHSVPSSSSHGYLTAKGEMDLLQCSPPDAASAAVFCRQCGAAGWQWVGM